MQLRLKELEACEQGGGGGGEDTGKKDLAKIEKLVREINLCKERLEQASEDAAFEAVVLSVAGSRKMSAANIPSIFISITSLSLYPVLELMGTVFEVSLTWRRGGGGVRCTTRALLAMGAPSRGELILGTLCPITTAAPGMKVAIRFFRFIRAREQFNDNPVTTKNQIMLDLW